VDDRLEREWDDLALATGSPPFLRPGWVRASMSAFHGASTVWAVTERRAGRLAGLLPVRPGRRGLRTATNGETPGFEPVVADAEAAQALADRLLAAPFGLVDLRYLPGEDHGLSPADVVTGAAARRGMGVLRETMR